ncbi:MAG: tRNA-binding protein [Candidatus Paracaedibacteraceae bacterium]|nr:tRNA-binding protein [Candidatus Paracaedibacteraceae bacterium]
MTQITYDDFEKVDLRSGTVIKAEPNLKAKKPAYKIWVDFGDQIGIKQTSAQVTHHYTPEMLIGKSVLGCLNLGTRNIAGFTSEFLLVGFSDNDGHIILATTDSSVPNGNKLH